MKSIKHISLLRNHISQNQGQPTQQTMPPSPQQQQQQQMTTINTQQQQQLVNSDEPTDLRTHTHQPIDCGEQPQQSPSTTYETVTEMRRLAQQQQKQQQSIITTAQTSSANSTSPANLYHPPPPASHQAEDLSISPASSITIKSEIS